MSHSNDARFMTADVSDKYYRLEEGVYFNHAARFVIEGTLSDILFNVDGNKLEFPDCTLLAGSTYWMPSNKEFHMVTLKSKDQELTEVLCLS